MLFMLYKKNWYQGKERWKVESRDRRKTVGEKDLERGSQRKAARQRARKVK